MCLLKKKYLARLYAQEMIWWSVSHDVWQWKNKQKIKCDIRMTAYAFVVKRQTTPTL